MAARFSVKMVPFERAACAATLSLCALGAPLAAQDEVENLQETPETNEVASGLDALSDETITFEADSVDYDSAAERITARGNVILRNADASVRADEVEWNRNTSTITARGNVRFVDRSGNQIFTETVQLNDAFEAGAMDDLLLALRTGGRLAARSAERGEDGVVVLNEAAYSACPVTDEEGCDRDPSWRITADRVRYDPEESRIRFDGAMLELFGARLLPLPGLALRTDGAAESGFLVPNIRFDQVNGLEVSGEYYWRMADNKDLTLGTHIYTDAAPMARAQFRHFTEKGAYQITGYATNSRRVANFGVAPTSESDPRGYLAANGRFIFSPEWSLTGSIRLASDRTFLRRYDISRDDRLRSTINLERIDDNSYFSLAGWATQTLRIAADQGQIPLAVPALDYRQRLDQEVLGGTVEFQANTLALIRDEGQDTQRAFAGAKWDLRTLTGLGQMVTLTGLVRGDVYNTEDTLSTLTQVYRGQEGWTTRGIATAAVDVEWPFVGEAFGGTQVLTPRVQLVASPNIRNLAVPNEDARAIDLEDSNLFALNRFSGYDRVEDGARVTYGFDWELNRPGWRIKTNIGQSYRLTNEEEIFPDGTGLSDRFSDFVGRTEVRYKNFVKFTHRFRLDKDNFAVRRNEIDAAIGSQRNYVEIGYLRLNRNIQTVEDLSDREEVRAAARVTIGRNWSVFGSGVFNLTDEDEDPVFAPDGFEPIRTRLGIAYRDDCIEFGATWRRDFITFGDAEQGNSFRLFFALRNLGFR
ncbi:LPS assembly protein LptD [Qipengyuania sp. S6317L1]|uniref:LPS-assembly protein LptD n=1 Tax=Qipengyuania sp. S6317L1 TaxID=2926410 RepID=UPI001FF5AA69|nr:LPS assembly protein LptD [Qipengyuania sp. S6317L1]MCK0098141.1 LPS assembly protein LptD [Qipengyuania sp. S6317L1]